LFLSPPWHYSFSSSTSLLFFDGASPPTFCQHCSYSSLTLFFLLLLLDVIHVPSWHRSSSTPMLFLNDIPPFVLFRHDSYSSSTSLLLLFFDVTPPHALLQHFSFSSLMPLLLLLLQVPFYSPLNVVVFPLNIIAIPLVLNWYFPPSCFCRCRRSKPSKFDLPPSN
jgi:hypothetical protein